jgi:hypothetical protein
MEGRVKRNRLAISAATKRCNILPLAEPLPFATVPPLLGPVPGLLISLLEAAMRSSSLLRHSLLATAILSSAVVLTSSLFAAPPWAKLIPYTKVEADPQKDYELTESHGPWMVMCISFTGGLKAEEQAHDLVLELRQRYHVPAFIYRKHFDMGAPEIGLGFNKYGGQKIMRNNNAYKRDEIAVLVGNFQSVDSAEIEKALANIKTMQPDTLNAKKTGEQTFQTWGTIRGMFSETRKALGKKERGPMGSAFVTRNPLLPEEYFAPKGLDPFVVELNQGIKYSLLKCPGKYTVKVASFRGVESMKPKEFDELAGKAYKPADEKNSRYKGMTKIDIAADKAIQLTKALRAKGVEAYEFHDRTESIVCVGSFDSVGDPREDGKIEINPGIHRLMETYGPEKKFVPGRAEAYLQPRFLDGVPFDPQPLPVVVPKQSIASDYARRASHEE